MLPRLKRNWLVVVLLCWCGYQQHELTEVRAQAEEALAMAEDAANTAEEAQSAVDDLDDTPVRRASAPAATRRHLSPAEAGRPGLPPAGPAASASGAKAPTIVPGVPLTAEQARQLGDPSLAGKKLRPLTPAEAEAFRRETGAR